MKCILLIVFMTSLRSAAIVAVLPVLQLAKKEILPVSPVITPILNTHQKEQGHHRPHHLHNETKQFYYNTSKNGTQIVSVSEAFPNHDTALESSTVVSAPNLPLPDQPVFIAPSLQTGQPDLEEVSGAPEEAPDGAPEEAPAGAPEEAPDSSLGEGPDGAIKEIDSRPVDGEAEGTIVEPEEEEISPNDGTEVIDGGGFGGGRRRGVRLPIIRGRRRQGGVRKGNSGRRQGGRRPIVRGFRSQGGVRKGGSGRQPGVQRPIIRGPRRQGGVKKGSGGTRPRRRLQGQRRSTAARTGGASARRRSSGKRNRSNLQRQTNRKRTASGGQQKKTSNNRIAA